MHSAADTLRAAGHGIRWLVSWQSGDELLSPRGTRDGNWCSTCLQRRSPNLSAEQRVSGSASDRNMCGCCRQERQARHEPVCSAEPLPLAGNCCLRLPLERAGLMPNCRRGEATLSATKWPSNAHSSTPYFSAGCPAARHAAHPERHSPCPLKSRALMKKLINAPRQVVPRCWRVWLRSPPDWRC